MCAPSSCPKRKEGLGKPTRNRDGNGVAEDECQGKIATCEKKNCGILRYMVNK
jgi:hypothetical protein